MGDKVLHAGVALGLDQLFVDRGLKGSGRSRQGLSLPMLIEQDIADIGPGVHTRRVRELETVET